MEWPSVWPKESGGQRKVTSGCYGYDSTLASAGRGFEVTGVLFGSGTEGVLDGAERALVDLFSALK